MPSDAQPPQLTPSPVEIAEVELALWGITTNPVRVAAPAPLVASATTAGRLQLTDPEGAPLAHLRADGSGGDTGGLIGTVEAIDGRRPSGPFASRRKPPAEIRFPGAEIIVCSQPPDAHQLAAADPARPLVFVVLDGPRVTPGPPVELVALAARRARPRGAAATDGMVIVPAPEYGDHRDDALAERIAEAYGGRLIRPRRRPDRAALTAWLDRGAGSDAQGDAAVHADWPHASLQMWRRWRPPLGERGVVVFFTGLSGSGKSTVAGAVTTSIAEGGTRTVTSLDGDVVRRHLSAGLGFSREDRNRNVERIGFVAAEVARHGGIAVCAPIAPFGHTRTRVRDMVRHAGADFVLVHVATPLDECERRDRKGLYARARSGDIPDFTGISSPYEVPDDADVVIDTTDIGVDAARDAVLQALRPHLR